MMPMESNAAALQFFTEAMRANTSQIEGFREEAREDRTLLHQIHVKVAKIEARDHTTSIVALTARVKVLETENDKREGARAAGDWLIDKMPPISAMFIAVLIAVIITLKATGRI